MNKDLFSVVFAELSSFTEAEYQTNFVERLPLLLLDVARETVPALATLEGFDDVERRLGDGAGHWRNPELFPHLMALPSCREPASQAHLDALRVHLNLHPPTPSLCRTSRFVRLRTPRATVLESRASSLSEIRGVVSSPHGERGPLVYGPHRGLFDDVAQGLYHVAEPAADVERLAALVTAALNALRSYSIALADSVLNTVATVAFTTDDWRITRSFSMRTRYLGGVFTAVCDPTALAENLLHEYYHCRIWTWWLVERPPDLPSDDDTLISPVTGMRRPVSVMMHALLIYASLIDYHRAAANARRSPDADARRHQLERRTATLVDTLHGALRHRPFCQRFIDVVAGVVAVS